MMTMTEESSVPRMTPTSLEPGDGEMSILRKEVIEARNLIMKNDNLLKNLHAEVKNMARRAEQQESRHIYTSVTAYILFAVLIAAGSFLVAKSAMHTAREEAQANEARAASLQKDMEKMKAAEQVRRE